MLFIYQYLYITLYVNVMSIFFLGSSQLIVSVLFCISNKICWMLFFFVSPNCAVDTDLLVWYEKLSQIMYRKVTIYVICMALVIMYMKNTIWYISNLLSMTYYLISESSKYTFCSIFLLLLLLETLPSLFFAWNDLSLRSWWN